MLKPLTGIQDIDIKILNQLSDLDLINVCQTNRMARELCRSEKFWMNRIVNLLPQLTTEQLLEFKRDRSWADYYTKDLSRINNNILYLFNGATNGRLDWIILFEARGGNIHSYNDDSLINASYHGHLSIVKYLINRGVNKKLDRALSVANKNGHTAIVKYLSSVDPSKN